MENEKMILECINHAIKSLTAALNLLPGFGVSPSNKDLALIKSAITNKYWEIYLIRSTCLTTKEVIIVKEWFDYIKNRLIDYINEQATNNTQSELKKRITFILIDKNLLAVKEKLEQELNK